MIKVPQFPTVAKLPVWKLAPIENVAAASGRRDHKVTVWMREVGDKELESGCPALRRKGKGDLGSINEEDLLRRLKHEIDNKITE